MPCDLTVETIRGQVDLISPLDFWATQAAVLAAMGIADRRPVISAERANALARQADAERAAGAAQGAASSTSSGGRRRK